MNHVRGSVAAVTRSNSGDSDVIRGHIGRFYSCQNDRPLYSVPFALLVIRCAVVMITWYWNYALGLYCIEIRPHNYVVLELDLGLMDRYKCIEMQCKSKGRCNTCESIQYIVEWGNWLALHLQSGKGRKIWELLFHVVAVPSSRKGKRALLRRCENHVVRTTVAGFDMRSRLGAVNDWNFNLIW